MDYSRIPDEIDYRDEVELGYLVDEIWEQIVDAFPGRQAVLQRPEKPLAVRCSIMALERILANLLRNAVGYVPEDRRPKVKVGWRHSAGAMTITIADNGIGIPRDEQDKIFELFHRGQPAAGEGSGVGLAIVKKITDAAEGTISVASRPGEGTVFTVNLPLKSAN
ncbi:sensor histidine kinase [Candidatus Zixiibacteriota bacterium]